MPARCISFGDLAPGEESRPVDGSDIDEEFGAKTRFLKQRERGFIIRRMAIVKGDDHAPRQFVRLALRTAKKPPSAVTLYFCDRMSLRCARNRSCIIQYFFSSAGITGLFAPAIP